MSLLTALNSESRLREVEKYDVLDTSREEAFDRVTRLVCKLFKVQGSAVTVIDGHRQWFKSRQGLEATETALDASLCKFAVIANSPIVIPDTLEHKEYSRSACVPGTRFYAGVPVRGDNGQIIATLCAFDSAPRQFSADELMTLSDLAKVVETEFALRLLASQDSLTGVSGRRAFFLEGEKALDLAARHRYDLSCILFDLDHFKAINDTYGHGLGDVVLSRVAEACQSNLRKSDIVGRLGGEEFAVILPHTSVLEAQKVAETMRKCVESLDIEHRASRVKVSASFGISYVTNPAVDVQLLLQRADEAMYQAKDRGRNCIVVWQGKDSEEGLSGRRVIKAGSIAFNHGRSSIDCTVRRISNNGATLQVVSTDGVPARFKLSISTDNFSRVCSVASKNGQHIEVTFAA